MYPTNHSGRGRGHSPNYPPTHPQHPHNQPIIIDPDPVINEREHLTNYLDYIEDLETWQPHGAGAGADEFDFDDGDDGGMHLDSDPNPNPTPTPQAGRGAAAPFASPHDQMMLHAFRSPWPDPMRRMPVVLGTQQQQPQQQQQQRQPRLQPDYTYTYHQTHLAPDASRRLRARHREDRHSALSVLLDRELLMLQALGMNEVFPFPFPTYSSSIAARAHANILCNIVLTTGKKKKNRPSRKPAAAS